MIPKLLLMTFGLLALAGAFMIPPGQPEGIYMVSLDENDREVHKKMDFNASGAVLEPIPTAMMAPPLPYATCEQLSVGNDDMFGKAHAWDQFWGGCGALSNTVLYDKRAFYAYYGDSVAFMCNYSKRGNYCRQNDWVYAVGVIRGQCQLMEGSGRSQTGWVSYPAWSLSYGFTRSDHSFC